jgi:sugar diacid utilization regulator
MTAVTPLRQLVDAPALRGKLAWIARPERDSNVVTVSLAEDLGKLRHAPADGVVLLTESASAEAGTYRFDVGLRLARTRGVAAIVLSGQAFDHLSPTAEALAGRAGIGILAARERIDLAELAVVLSRELLGAADVALLRAHAAMRAIVSHPRDGRPEALAEHVGAALGVEIALADAEGDALAAPIVVDDAVERWLTASPQDGDLALAAELVLRLAADALARQHARTRRAEELPIRSRAEALTELLAAGPQERPQLVRQVRDVGIPIDGWHIAARLELENAAELAGDQEFAAYETRQAVFRAALQTLRAGGGTWHTAQAGSAALLLRGYREDPGVTATGETLAMLDRALERAHARLPAAVLRCGVGSVHAGPTGLVNSVAEAKAAVAAARASNRVNCAVAFDSVGLRRTLLEWYASDPAREAVATVLEPLDRLGGRKAQQAIQTLQAYLDRQGSLSKTAEALNLHRNAVAYRINRIFAELDVDRESPDDLLLLQLACRARQLA